MKIFQYGSDRTRYGSVVDQLWIELVMDLLPDIPVKILNGWWTGKLPEMKVDLTEHIETIRISKWAELPNDLAVDFLILRFHICLF